MTVAELKKTLTENLVPAKLYQIGGEVSGRICLEKVNDAWEVFFCEGKKKIGTLFFRDENSACARMLREVTKAAALLDDAPLSLA